MSVDPVLHVNRHGRVLSFRIEGIQSVREEPLWPQYTQAVSDAVLDDLQRESDRIVRAAPRAGLLSDLTELGLLLYDNIVPEGIRSVLRDHSGSLYVWTEIGGIPWELLHDGEQFWGLRYQLGRRIITSVAPRSRLMYTKPEDTAILVVASDPRGELPWVPQEVESIVSSFGADASVCVLSGVRAAVIDVIRELRRGIYGIVHYCGHGVTEPATGEGALLLCDGKILSASTICSNLRGRPIVFLNACQSARGSQQGRVSENWNGITSSLADAFLAGGAAGVIGTVADVGDQEGTQFARLFYQRILTGQPVGEAIRSIRLKFFTEQPDNPVWATFVLYGTPTVLIGGVRPVSGAIPVPPAPVARRGSQSSVEPEGDEDGVSRGESWQQVVTRVKPAVLHVESERGAGTGFLVGQAGYAVTCCHIVENLGTVTVRFIDGREVLGTVLGTDPAADLALLRLSESPPAQPMRLAESERIQEGQTVLAIGHPFGFSFTVSRGIVSSRCRVFKSTAYVQTDTALNPGNSGGPIISESGEVVGVASWGVRHDAEGIGFGIATPHLRALLARFRVRRDRS
jgi:hypothetical protein